MYKLPSVALDPASVPDPNLDHAVMYRLAPPTAGSIPQNFEEFESGIKNDAQSCILSSGGVVLPSVVSNGTCVTGPSQALREIIEKLGAFSSTSLPSEHLHALQNWESLLKKIQKLEELVSKAESVKKVSSRGTPKQTPAPSSKASPAPAAPVSHVSEPSQPLPSASASESASVRGSADVVIELPDEVADASPCAAVCAAVLALAKQSCVVRVVQYVHSSAQQPLAQSALMTALSQHIDEEGMHKHNQLTKTTVRLIWKRTPDVALVFGTAVAARRCGAAAAIAPLVELAPAGSNSAVLDLARKAASGNEEALRRLADTLLTSK